jgi:hypothetical protein
MKAVAFLQINATLGDVRTFAPSINAQQHLYKVVPLITTPRHSVMEHSGDFNCHRHINISLQITAVDRQKLQITVHDIDATAEAIVPTLLNKTSRCTRISELPQACASRVLQWWYDSEPSIGVSTYFYFALFRARAPFHFILHLKNHVICHRLGSIQATHLLIRVGFPIPFLVIVANAFPTERPMPCSECTLGDRAPPITWIALALAVSSTFTTVRCYSGTNYYSISSFCVVILLLLLLVRIFVQV